MLLSILRDTITTLYLIVLFLSRIFYYMTGAGYDILWKDGLDDYINPSRSVVLILLTVTLWKSMSAAAEFEVSTLSTFVR